MTAQPKPTAAADIPFTPTDDEMRYAYARDLPSATSEFDRWLAEHDAQVAAQALTHAADELQAMLGADGPGNRSTGYGRAGLDLLAQVRARADRIAAT